MNKEIKILYNKEIKRFEFTQSYQNFIDNIKNSFKLPEAKEFLIKYQDDEMDYIAISSEFDLQQVLIFMENKNLHVLRGYLEVREENVLGEKQEEFYRLEDNNNVQENILKEESSNILNLEVKNQVIPSINQISRSLKLTESFVNIINNENLDNNLALVKNNINYNNPKEATIENTDPSPKIPENSLQSVDGLEIIQSLIVNQEKEESLNKTVQEDEKKIKDLKDESNQESQNKKLEKKKEKEMKKEKKALMKEKKSLERFNQMKNLFDNQTMEMKDFLTKIIDEKFAEMLTSLKNEKNSSPSIHHQIESLQHIFYKNQPINPTIHKVSCKSCNSNEIKGNRYKCSVCEDYNLCEDCENFIGLKHGHPFLKIREAVDILNMDVKNEEKKIEDVLRSNEIISSKCISENTGEFECGNQVIIKVIYENNGKTDWPSKISLKNVHGLFGNDIKINRKVKAGETISFDIRIYSDHLKPGEYASRWALFDDVNNIQIGNIIDLKFKMISKKESQNFIQNRNYRFKHLLNKFKETYLLNSVSDEKILDSLEKSDGKMEEALGFLF